MLGPGTVIRHYEIIRELGRGGMGRVFVARDTRLGRRVAMKFLTADSPELADRFLIEARATARCSHENIVVIHEVDAHEGQPYMVLEYLEGSTLARVMAGRRLGAGQSAELMVPVVRALARAHEFGIVHRDLKPENIFVTSAGIIKVLDFGIAKVFARDREDVAREAEPFDPVAALLESVPAGTLPYMAPEQLFMEVDERTDLWAVGVILHEMLAGQHPFAGLHPDRMVQEIVDAERPVPPLAQVVAGVPEAMQQLVARCLAKDKEARFASARELLVELEGVVPRRFGRPLREDESPFPGLSVFQEGDAERFFGRSQEVAQMLAILGRQPIAGVVGPSGVGKSSFVRAGVVPALKAADETWEALILRPGRRPLSSLAGLLARLDTGSGPVAPTVTVYGRTEPALPAPPSGHRPTEPTVRARPPEPSAVETRLRAEPGFLGAHLRERALRKSCHILLFVDQLEELHTLGAEAGERAAFLACLAAMADDVASPLRVIVAMRSDFFDRIAEDRRFTDELTRGLLLLRPLGGDALREAMVQPLDLAGYRFESSDIIDHMVDALADTAGALPLLQFAAARLWDGRDRARKVLTRATYDEIGGVSGALASHADAVLQALPPSVQKLARSVVTRLVTPERTRAVVDLDELRQLAPRPADVESLVEHLAAARLLVMQARGEAEGPTVELVHDSLVESWPALRRWLDESKEEAAFLAELRAAARQWEARGRKPGLLWRGEALEEARPWRARLSGELAQREADFLHAAFALASRASRIRRGLITATIGLLLAIVAAGGVALISIRRAKTDALAEAERAQREAERAQREAERARSAELRVKDQLELLGKEQHARQEANAQVKRGEAELGVVNRELEQALAKAQAESRRAQDAAAKSEELAVSLRRANDELQRLLANERARAAQLEKERKKIMTELR